MNSIEGYVCMNFCEFDFNEKMMNNDKLEIFVAILTTFTLRMKSLKKDSLDGILESEYNHGKDLWPGKNDIFRSEQTANAGRSEKIRKSRIMDEIELEKSSRIVRNRIASPRNSLRNASKNIHSCSSNNGYSRKVDGGFYLS
ncbi:MAG: hypothetical protein MHPSP_000174 [Paramarteilia canceri]